MSKLGGAVETNAFAVLFPVSMVKPPSWVDGPLTVEYMPGTPHEIVSDWAGRKRYVPGKQLPHILWGDALNPRRWHKKLTLSSTISADRGVDFDVRVDALEVMRAMDLRGNDAFAVVHGTVLHSDLQVLRGLVELSNIDTLHGAKVREFYQSLLGERVVIAKPTRRAKMLSMVCGSDAGLPQVAENLETDWTRQDQWLWHLATCHMPNTITVGRDSQKTLASRTIHVSDEWKGFVAGEGAAYAANNKSQLLETLPHAVEQRLLRIRSMEADAMLLAELQDNLASRITDGLFALRRGDVSSSRAETIESYLSAYRLMYWGDRLTERGYSNDLLVNLREVKRLPERVIDLRLAVEDATSELAEDAASATNAALALLAVAGFPIGTSLTTWTALEVDPTWRGLGLALLSAACMAGALMLVFPGLRRTLPRLFRSRGQ